VTSEPGLPPESRPPDADEVDDMLAKIEGAIGAGEDPGPPAAEPPSGWTQWAIMGAIGCALAGVAALSFGWAPAPSPRALSVWQATLVEGALVGLASGLAFSWWEAVQRGRIDPLSGALLLLAGATLCLTGASFLVEQLLGSSDPFSIYQRAVTSLQLSAVLLAALLAHVKARILPLRPLLALAGGAFASSAIAQILGPQVGGELVATTGLPYAPALPIAWTLGELFGRSPLTTGAD
jgi:hypothetical protein